MALSKDQILNANDLKIEEVQVPEWGGSVFVRGMTGSERDKYEASVTKLRGKEAQVDMRNMRAKLLVYTVCDESGTPLFSEADIEALGKKSANALQRLWEVAVRLSGISGQEAEEIEKN